MAAGDKDNAIKILQKAAKLNNSELPQGNLKASVAVSSESWVGKVDTVMICSNNLEISLIQTESTGTNIHNVFLFPRIE